MKPFVVEGNHYDCGKQIGIHFKNQIQKAISENGIVPKSANQYLKATANAYPEIIEELKGVADEAGVNLLQIHSFVTEELTTDVDNETKACTDIILTSPLTDGRVLIGHNNDLPTSYKDLIFPIIWKFNDGTSMFTVGPLGFYISCGINNKGIVLTGNQVYPNDNKIGVPRSIIARAILMAKDFNQAVSIATDIRRASSYNNIISTQNNILDIEGSATTESSYSPQNGFLIHSNHYCDPNMLKFEGKPNHISSIERLSHAQKLIASNKNQILTHQDLITMLKDHNGMSDGDDNTICRHGDKNETVFGIIFDLKDKLIKLSLGNPCRNNFETVEWPFSD